MKFLVLYRAPISAVEQMAKATPDQAKAGMDAWMTWAEKTRSAIIDLGAPLGEPRATTPSPGGAGSAKIVGYSIIQADSMDAAIELLRDHPHKEEIITGEIPYTSDLFRLCQENGWLNIRRGVSSIRESRTQRRAMSA